MSQTCRWQYRLGSALLSGVRTCTDERASAIVWSAKLGRSEQPRSAKAPGTCVRAANDDSVGPPKNERGVSFNEVRALGPAQLRLRQPNAA